LVVLPAYPPLMLPARLKADSPTRACAHADTWQHSNPATTIPIARVLTLVLMLQAYNSSIFASLRSRASKSRRNFSRLLRCNCVRSSSCACSKVAVRAGVWAFRRTIV